MRKHKQPSQAPKQSRSRMINSKMSKPKPNVSVQNILERKTPRSSSKSHRIESSKRIQKVGTKKKNASPNMVRKSSPITTSKNQYSMCKPKNQKAMQVAQSHANMKLKDQDQILSALHPQSFRLPEPARNGPNYWVNQLHQVQRPLIGDHVRNNQSFGGYPAHIEQVKNNKLYPDQQAHWSANTSQMHKQVENIKEPLVYIETVHGYQRVNSDSNGQYVALSAPGSTTTSVLQGQIHADRSRQNNLPFARHSYAASRTSGRSSEMHNSTAPCYSINIPPGQHLNQQNGQSNYHISYKVVDQNKVAPLQKSKRPISKSRSRSRSVKKSNFLQKAGKVGDFESFQKNSGKYPQRRSQMLQMSTRKQDVSKEGRKQKNKRSSVSIQHLRSRSRISRSKSSQRRQAKYVPRDQESEIHQETRRRQSSGYLIPAQAPIFQGRIVDCASKTQTPVISQDINRSISSQQKSFRTLQHDEYQQKGNHNRFNSKRTTSMVGDSPYSENKNLKRERRGQGGASARSLNYENYQLPEERRSFLGRSLRHGQNPFVTDIKHQMFESSIKSSENSDIYFLQPDEFQQSATRERETPTMLSNSHLRSVSITENNKKKKAQKSTPRSLALPYKKVKKANARKSASRSRKSSKMITTKERSIKRGASAKKSVSQRRKHSEVRYSNYNSELDLYKVPDNYLPMRIHQNGQRIQKQQSRMNSVMASQPCFQYRKNSWEHILGPGDFERLENRQYSQRRSHRCYSISDGDREYKDIIKQVNIHEETQKLGEREIKQEVIEMKVRQENRLELLKSQMKKSLIEVKETKARLFQSKDTTEAPCLRDQVEKISQRIERIIEERHEREQSKQRDRKLRLEMEKMRVRRIMRNTNQLQENSGQQLKQDLLRRLSEQIDEELELVGAQGLSQLNNDNILASFSKLPGVFRSPTHNESLMMSAADGGSRLGLQEHSQRSDRVSAPIFLNRRSSCKGSTSKFDIDQVGSHIVAERSKSKSRHGSMKSIESCKSVKSKRSRKMKSSSISKSQKRKKSIRQRNLQEQIYQTECLNSKNSTIVHQCEAIPSSARPEINQKTGKAKRKSLSRSRTGKAKILQTQPQMSFSKPFEVEDQKIQDHPVSKKLRFHLDQTKLIDDKSSFYSHSLNKGGPQQSEPNILPKQQSFYNRENTSPKIQASRGSTTTFNRKSILKNSSAKKTFGLSPGSQISQKSQSQNSSSSDDERFKVFYPKKEQSTIPRELIGRNTVYSSSDSDEDSDLRQHMWKKGPKVVSTVYQTNLVKSKNDRGGGQHVSIR